MPASVEILTKTHELVRTNVSILLTLTLSLGPTCAAAVGCAVNAPSRPYSAPAPRTLPTQDRRSMFDDMSRSPSLDERARSTGQAGATIPKRRLRPVVMSPRRPRTRDQAMFARIVL